MNKHWKLLPLTATLVVFMPACVEDLGFDDETLDAGDHDGDDETPDGGDDADDGDSGDADGETEETGETGETGDDRFEHQALGGGVVRTIVDATDEASFVYLDLDAQFGTATPDPGWDLGFSRFNIIVNGGISGDAGVEVALVDGADFEQLSEVPVDAVWITDAPDGDDEDTDPDLAFADWYDYDFMTHVLTPKDRVYLVRTDEGALFKLQIANYYSEAGSSGHLTFYWAPLG
jgi:hypothetical protein